MALSLDVNQIDLLFEAISTIAGYQLLKSAFSGIPLLALSGLTMITLASNNRLNVTLEEESIWRDYALYRLDQ